MDREASISLFHALCRIGKTANPHMAEQAEKIERISRGQQQDLEKLLTGHVTEHAIEHFAANLGLDGMVLSFLIRNSIGPSIEAGMEKLRGELDPEASLTTHCPVCGSLPSAESAERGGGEGVIPFAPSAAMNGGLTASPCGVRQQGAGSAAVFLWRGRRGLSHRSLR